MSRVLAAAALTAVAATAARGQDLACGPGRTEVRRLQFEGNRSFSYEDLANAIVTTPSSWTRRTIRLFGTRRCLDRDEFSRDRLRLFVFYRNHGFPDVTVDTAERALGPGVAGILFRVHEGIPTRIDALLIGGLDEIDPATRGRMAKDLPVSIGGRFDKYAVDAARDTLRLRLENTGYPFADVLRSYTTDTVRHVANVELDAVPGPRARIGRIIVQATPRTPTGRPKISDAVVRRISELDSGALYRLRDLGIAQRELYQTQDYQRVNVGILADTTGAPPRRTQLGGTDTTVDIGVRVLEGYMHSARVGVGWGTLDCFRTQAQYTDRDFLGQTDQLQLTALLTKIGLAHPFDFAPGLCSQARQDIYRDTLNYSVSAGIGSRTLFGLHVNPHLTVYSAKRSEFNAFVRSTPIGGLASLTDRVTPTITLTPSYELEYGATYAQAAFFCVVFSLCSQEDQARAQQQRRLAVVSLAAAWDRRRGDPDNPIGGTLATVVFRHASRLIGSDPALEFDKVTADAAWYVPLADVGVVATRVRVGAVFGGSRVPGDNGARFIPPEERLYAGGPTTVRGYPQNGLGPVAYLPNAVTVDTVGGVPYYQPDRAQGQIVIPEGGNSSIVANIEFRLHSPFLPRLLQWTFFDDGGQVWTTTSRGGIQMPVGQLEWTPGVGLRVFSPVGPIRVDVGYDPHSHLRPGPVYYNPPLAGGVAPLFCVTPGTLPGQQEQGANAPACPATYVPAPQTGFFRRLTLNFSIGQAF